MRRVKRVTVAKVCLKKLKDGHFFSYCLEIGVKTVSLTLNLNPRSQAERLDPAELTQQITMHANIVFQSDK